MNDTLTLAPQRTFPFLGAAVLTLALFAMLALGFAIRVWTEHTPRPAPPAAVVQIAPGSVAPDCKLGRAC
jgi:hypothetical protein